MATRPCSTGDRCADVLGGLTEAALGVDHHGTIVCANAAVCELLGFSADDLNGRRIWRLDSESSQGFWQRWSRAPQWHAMLHRQFVTADGDTLPVMIGFVPGRSANLCLVRRREALSGRSGRRMRFHERLFRDFDVPQLVVDAHDGTLIDANTAAVEFYGWPRDALRDRNLADLDDSPGHEVLTRLSRARDDRATQFECRHRLRSGSIRDVRTFTLRLRRRQRSLLHMIVHDVTDVMQLNHELAGYRDLIERLPVGVFRTTADPDGRILMANRTLCEILDCSSPAELIGLEPASFYADPEGRRHFREQVRDGPEISYAVHRLVTRRGRPITVRMTARRVEDELGRVFFEGAMEDITEWERTRAGMQQAERIIESASEGIAITDASVNIIRVNPSFTRITGYSEAEVLGRNPRMLSSGNQSAQFYQRMWRQLERTDHWQGEILNRRKNGEVYPQWLTISAIRDESGAIQNYAAVFTDLTTIQRSRAAVERLERLDPLTELYNRGEFIRRLAEYLDASARQRRPACLVVVGIDDFTRINNVYSLEAGDQVLVALAQRFLALREAGAVLVGRTNSDEFALLFGPDSRAAGIDGEDCAECALREARRPIPVDGAQRLTVRVSAGVSLSPRDAQTAERLLGHAEATLGRAKKSNRGGYRLFERALEAAEERRVWLRQELDSALADDALTLAYQPIVELATGRIAGAEALARWRHPTEGDIPPDEFIGIAEESGFMDRLTLQLMESACGFVTDLQEHAGGNLRLSFNVSAMQLLDPELPDRVVAVLDRTGLPPQLFKIELTESRLMSELDRSLDCIRRLQRAGMGIAIDDFGTGFSSLAYLQQIRPQALKIDRRFIRRLPDDREDAAIAATMITMAHKLGQEVIAEGVETKAQLRFLRDEGCDYYQGYLFSRPVPAAAFRRLLLR